MTEVKLLLGKALGTTNFHDDEIFEYTINPNLKTSKINAGDILQTSIQPFVQTLWESCLAIKRRETTWGHRCQVPSTSRLGPDLFQLCSSWSHPLTPPPTSQQAHLWLRQLFLFSFGSSGFGRLPNKWTQPCWKIPEEPLRL